MSHDESIGTKIFKVLQGSLAAAGVAAAATYILLGEKASIPMLGYNIPIAVAVGAAVLVGEIASHAALPYIFKYLPLGKRFVKLETGLAAAAISGGVSIGVLMLTSSAAVASDGIAKIFTLGAASAFIGDNINDLLFSAEHKEKF